MSSRTKIREGLAKTLADNIDDLRTHADTPRQINTPCAVVIQLDEQRSAASRNTRTYTAVVRLLTGGDIRPAQERLDELADQIPDAIEADPTLDGNVVEAAWVRTRGDSEGMVEMGGTSGFATFTVVDFEVEILT